MERHVEPLEVAKQPAAQLEQHRPGRSCRTAQEEHPAGRPEPPRPAQRGDDQQQFARRTAVDDRRDAPVDTALHQQRHGKPRRRSPPPRRAPAAPRRCGTAAATSRATPRLAATRDGSSIGRSSSSFVTARPRQSMVVMAEVTASSSEAYEVPLSTGILVRLPLLGTCGSSRLRCSSCSQSQLRSAPSSSSTNPRRRPAGSGIAVRWPAIRRGCRRG